MEKYKELCFRMIDLGIFPVFFGGKENSSDIARIIADIGCGCNAAELGLTIRQSTAFMEKCRFYVGNDTGTLHMAAAAGLRCVGIYSAHNYPNCWSPYGSGHIVLRHDVPCTVCLKSNCPHGHAECINNISVDEVLHAVKQMLEAIRI